MVPGLLLLMSSALLSVKSFGCMARMLTFVMHISILAPAVVCMLVLTAVAPVVLIICPSALFFIMAVIRLLKRSPVAVPYFI